MAKNTMRDLRDHLFETLEALKDEQKPMELDRAKQICEVAQVLINSAKVEVDFMEVTGVEVKNDFFDRPQLMAPGAKGALPRGA